MREPIRIVVATMARIKKYVDTPQPGDKGLVYGYASRLESRLASWAEAQMEAELRAMDE